MLKSLEINNYRCFDSHKIDFKKLTIAVGKNNAGKSTFIETIRLLSLVSSRFKNLVYRDPPQWTELPKRIKGVTPSIEGIDLSITNIFYRYGQPPARIVATFSNDTKIDLYVGEGAQLFGIIVDNRHNIVTNKAQARDIEIPEIYILPQIEPLRTNERVLNAEYVRQNLNTSNSSLHFRNQLFYLSGFFEGFKTNAEGTWSGLRIRSLETVGDMGEQELDLMVQDEYFVAEIGWMGHGLQMWLQTIWFLTRCSQSSTVILDEPDVYMHADLQRKLIRYLKERFSQVIVATHSIEIMSEVDADNILIIDKAKSKSLYATGKPSVQRIVNSIGSIHNIQLARLWASKKVLIVEGKDIEILKRIQNILLGQSNVSLDSIPNFSIGGWGGWSYAIGSKLLLKNAGDESLITYCIFDSDYHTEEEKSIRKQEAIEYGVSLHIWSKKEIENYLLNAEVISRLIAQNKRSENIVSKQLIQEKIESLAEEMKDDVTDAIANELQQKNRKINAGTAHRQARETLKKQSIIDVVSGKEIVSKLSSWSQTMYGVSFSANKLASSHTIKDIDKEMKEVIYKISK